MNAFEQASRYEEMARKELMPWLATIHREIEIINPEYTKDEIAYTMQIMGGDYLIHRLNGTSYLAEFKAEWTHTGNLFLETWSNKPYRPGWLLNCHADRLFYYFCEKEKLYIINLPELKVWAFMGRGAFASNEVEQTKYTQPNRTFGRLAWIPTLFDELPDGAIKHFVKEDSKYVCTDIVISEYRKEPDPEANILVRNFQIQERLLSLKKNGNGKNGQQSLCMVDLREIDELVNDIMSLTLEERFALKKWLKSQSKLKI